MANLLYDTFYVSLIIFFLLSFTCTIILVCALILNSRFDPHWDEEEKEFILRKEREKINYENN